MWPRPWFLVCLLLSGFAWAGPATERYAPTQLQVAQDLLQRARDAAAAGNYREAGKLAWEAELDARLAWGMTDAAPLRSQAAGVSQAAAGLVHYAGSLPAPALSAHAD